VSAGTRPSEDTVLAVRDLRTALHLRGGAVDVVREVSFSVRESETLALVGESGCGKTMTALSILRLVPDPPARIAGGEIWLDGQDVLKLSPRAMRRLRGEKASMVFQEPLTSLDPVFTIGAQLTEAITAHRSASRKEAEELAVKLLREVQIPSAEKRLAAYPHELSGGLRQRVMIAMALILNPRLLIADEPTTALDVTIQAQILDLIREEQERRKLAVLLITHNLAVVRQVAHRVAVMYAGEIVEEAPSDDLFENPRHPYTQGLLRSIPSIEEERDYLLDIPGRVPDPRLPPPACLFAPRCPFDIARCWQTHPDLEPETPEHRFRCWNPQPFEAIEQVERAQSAAASET
jgi:oligopeptide/dipeptide ABC transporter ATP-binding protein